MLSVRHYYKYNFKLYKRYLNIYYLKEFITLIFNIEINFITNNFIKANAICLFRDNKTS